MLLIHIVCILTVNVMFGEVHNNYCEWKEKPSAECYTPLATLTISIKY